MDKKIDQIDIDEATVRYYKSGKKVKKIQSTHFDIIQIEEALHVDIWSPSNDPYEKNQ